MKAPQRVRASAAPEETPRRRARLSGAAPHLRSSAPRPSGPLMSRKQSGEPGLPPNIPENPTPGRRPDDRASGCGRAKEPRASAATSQQQRRQVLETWGQGPESSMSPHPPRPLPGTPAVKRESEGGAAELPRAGRWGEEGQPQVPLGQKVLPGRASRHRARGSPGSARRGV